MMPSLEVKGSTLSKLFHEPVLNNGFLVFVNMDEDPITYGNRLATLYRPLNLADDKLRQTFKELNSLSFENQAVKEALTKWDEFIANRQNLAGVHCAKSVIDAFALSNVDIVTEIRDRFPDVISAFCGVPDRLKEVWRINVCIGYEHTNIFAEHLCEILASNSLAASLVERIEIIAHPRSVTPNFPTVVLYMYGPGNSNEILRNSFSEKFNDLTSAMPYGSSISHDFACPWNECVNITQGFKLYKVYLKLLGVLQSVYDEKRNYAFVLDRGAAYSWAKQLLGDS
jgi:hypothetical protein